MNTARGSLGFVAETAGRVRRAGATGAILWRFDSGFWNNQLMDQIEGRGDLFTVGIQTTARCGCDREDSRVRLGRGRGPRRRVRSAFTVYRGGWSCAAPSIKAPRHRCIGDWRHRALLTNLPGLVDHVDRTHRAYAVVELAIRDLKHDAGLIHMPSVVFQANAAVGRRVHAGR